MNDVNVAPLVPESRVMRLMRRLGLHSVAWSLRRLYVPVPPSALVLEVGSGGNPYFRSNVLIDAYEHTRERHYAPLVADRPTVLGYVERLPFKDKSFDFVIASHVLEHSPHPERFLSELARVARAGYIEVPDALMERLNPYLDHRLEITARSGRLIIRKKTAWRVDPELVELYEQRANRIIAGESIPAHPFEFHVRHYWQERIDFEIVNPGDDALWPAPSSKPVLLRQPSLRARLQSLALDAIRRIFSQNERNRNLDIIRLLQCPVCRDGGLRKSGELLECEKCGAGYEVVDGIPRLFLKSPEKPQE
jgi:SAM-dependent methyltransferase